MRPYGVKNMRYDSSRHHRRSVRLKHHDYSGIGMYVVTICACRRGEIFGRVAGDGTVLHNRFGRAVIEEWLESFEIRHELRLDVWLLMPDHLHAIVEIVEQTEVHPTPSGSLVDRAPRSVATLCGGFKGAAKLRISEMRGLPTKVWQDGFWDHVVRNERDLENQRQYIANNPARWLEKQRVGNP